MSATEPIQAGVKAPEFTLIDQEGRERSLSEFTGKGRPVVLFFYCLDWSPVCTPEMEALVDRWDEIGAMAEVVGIGIDSRWSHRAWSDHLGLPFPILTDRPAEAIKAYGLWNPEALMARRSTVILDEGGVVRDVEVGETGVGRDIPALVEKVGKLASR